MKIIKPVLLVLMIFSLAASCRFFAPKSSGNNGNTPKVDFVSPGKPVNVTVQTDKAHTASGTISAAGGSLTVTAADGAVFTLEVPAKAVDADTAITMTAVKSVTGAPLGSGVVSAVQLGPSGLTLKEIATLTIKPAKEIPVKEQIIFGYEGDGKDYHLAVVDPKTKDIKIKLMDFSGAGVGDGRDSAWAANLQIQAAGISTRLWQKFGELSQQERQRELLGDDSNSENFMAVVLSTLDQYEDQVVLKEMAAAELDCQFARKALHDLLSLERMRELMGSAADGGTGTRGFADKLNKLVAIGEKCKKSYTVSGVSNGVNFTGKICGLDKQFTIDATFPGAGSAKTTFDPESVTSGTTTVAGGGGACTQTGKGKYTVAITEDGSGSVTWTTTDTLACPGVSNNRTTTFTLPLKLAPGVSCE